MNVENASKENRRKDVMQVHLLKSRWKIALGVAPALLVYCIFSIIPIFISFYYSFMSWNGFSPMEFVGLANFKAILNDSVFWLSVRNNLIVVAASVFGQIPIALVLALLLNRKIKGAKFFRTIAFLPVVISTVVISLTWRMIYNVEQGLLNNLLDNLGSVRWRKTGSVTLIMRCMPLPPLSSGSLLASTSLSFFPRYRRCRKKF